MSQSPEAIEHGGQLRPKGIHLPRTNRGVGQAPKFQRCKIEAQLYGLKSNTSGEWMLTLKVPANCDAEVMMLSKAHGLALDMEISRKPIRSE
jgi:hypothetical protein